MQQYYNSYPSQPNYYTQPYDGSGPYNGYTPYAQQPQQNLWPIAPTPYTAANGLPPPMQIQSGTVPSVSNPYRSNHQRRATMPSNNPGKPLKSALKRNGTYAPSTPVPLQRKQALSYQKQNHMGMPMSVDYTNSNNKQGYQLDEDEAACMFVSFHGNNELHMENIAPKAMDEIRREIFGMWPGGTTLDELENTQWRVRFLNSPWSLRDENVQWAWKMLARLFTLFQERGFAYNTTLDVGSPNPRLLFIASEPTLCKFFLATITNRGRTFTMVDPPVEVSRDFTMGLQTSLGGHISRDDLSKLGETNLRVVELKRHTYGGASEITCNQYHCKLLRILDNIGYTVCATLPMARKGPLSGLGLGTRQELIVFKSTFGSPIV